MTTFGLREATPHDADAIERVILAAFPPDEGPSVARLTRELRADETAQPSLTLVAQEHDQVVGVILFTAIRIEERPDVVASILAPMAVAPERQRQGIGRQLIMRGLETLRQRPVELVLVLGDPEYYGRSGFHTNHTLQAPHPLPYPEAWMAQELRPGVLGAVTGRVQCARTLNAPEHW